MSLLILLSWCSALAVVSEAPAREDPVYAARESKFGYRLAACPDLDADGVSDFLVGAPIESPSPGDHSTGIVRAYSAASGKLLWKYAGDGLCGTSIASIRFRAEGVRGAALIGSWHEGLDAVDIRTGELLYSIEPMGQEDAPLREMVVVALDDVDGDDCEDFALSSPWADRPEGARCGHVGIRSGRDGRLMREWHGEHLAALGQTMTAVPDQNGDGFRDLACSLSEQKNGGAWGVVKVFDPRTGQRLTRIAPGVRGESSPLRIVGGATGKLGAESCVFIGATESDTVSLWSLESGKQIWSATQTLDGGTFGSALSFRSLIGLSGYGEGDDRYGPVVAVTSHGDPFKNTYGKVYLISVMAEVKTRLIIMASAWENFGASVLLLDDVNRDHIADVAVGACMTNEGAGGSGFVRIFSGNDGRTIRELRPQ